MALTLFNIDSGSVVVNEVLSDLYYEKHEFAKSENHLHRCLVIDANNPVYFYKKGRLAKAKKDTVNALFLFDKALYMGYNDPSGIVLYSNYLSYHCSYHTLAYR